MFPFLTILTRAAEWCTAARKVLDCAPLTWTGKMWGENKKLRAEDRTAQKEGINSATGRKGSSIPLGI